MLPEKVPILPYTMLHHLLAAGGLSRLPGAFELFLCLGLNRFGAWGLRVLGFGV